MHRTAPGKQVRGGCTDQRGGWALHARAQRRRQDGPSLGHAPGRRWHGVFSPHKRGRSTPGLATTLGGWGECCGEGMLSGDGWCWLGAAQLNEASKAEPSTSCNMPSPHPCRVTAAQGGKGRTHLLHFVNPALHCFGFSCHSMRRFVSGRKWNVCLTQSEL